MNKKITAAVTGANGFVGSHLVDFLLEKGFAVKCLVRKSSDLKWLNNKPVEIVNAGLFDIDALTKALKGVDYIFHVAGVVKSKKPEGYFEGNVETTRCILESALNYKDKIKKIVIVGSLTSSGPCIDKKPRTEEDIPNPITTYGRSKLEQEIKAKEYMDRLPITICRAPAVYGERDTEVFIFFKTFASGLMTKIGFNNKELSLIHAIDLVEGFYLAAISDKSAGQTYFISTEETYTWDDVSITTSRVMNKKVFTVVVPHFMVYVIAAVAQFFSIFSSKAATLNLEKVNDLIQEGWIASPAKAMRDLGYKQKISLEAGIRRSVEWYKKEGWLK